MISQTAEEMFSLFTHNIFKNEVLNIDRPMHNRKICHRHSVANIPVCMILKFIILVEAPVYPA